MNPFFFGDSKRQLFGAYHPAHGRSSRGVVICHPWAREYLLAYPTIKLLAQRLAESNWHVLRFDYFGTGDSAGDAIDASWPQWENDVETAIDELKDVGRATEIALIGMRIAAPLVVSAAAKRRDVRRLALWDPVVEGREYLREIGANGRTNAGPFIDVLGGVLPVTLRQSFEAVTLPGAAASLPPTLVISSAQGPSEAEQVLSRFRAEGNGRVLEHIPDVQVWREEWGRGGKGLAVNVVSRIVSWLY